MEPTTATAIATIAGKKSHIVPSRVLAQDLEQQVATGWAFQGGRNVRKFKTVVIPAGTTVYGAPLCGTTRTNGAITWDNHIALADEVTCAKCQKLGA